MSRRFPSAAGPPTMGRQSVAGRAPGRPARFVMGVMVALGLFGLSGKGRAGELAVGEAAPAFELVDQDGETRRLADYRGQWLVLYFYPKDDTPGCTTEACNFRDDFSEYQQAGVTILGVSPDSEESHTKFKSKYELPFTLLSDSDHKVSERYGVWGKKKMFGKEYEGIHRTTFLIGPDGVIEEVFEKVKPKVHSAEVLAVLDIP